MMNARRLLSEYRKQTRYPFNRKPKYARISAYARAAKTAEDHINTLKKYNKYWKDR